MNIFLTGISGLLGTNLIIDLLEKGHYVKGFIRDKSRYKGPSHQNLELIQGTFSDDLKPLLNDIDIVIHAAAETNQHLIHYADYSAVNYEATIRLMEAAVNSKIRKFIFVSTTNTLGFGSLDKLGDEQKKIRYPFSASFYAKSKLEAENYLLKQNAKTEVIIVNPGFIIGAYDSKPGSGRIILRGLNKKIIFYPCGGKSFVHVRDVAQGIINCLEKGKNGEKYLLVNENLSYLEFYRKLNAITSQHPVMIKIPRLVLIAMGYCGDLIKVLGIKTSISSVNMRILGIENFYSNKKSVLELGMKYQSIDSAITEAVNYFLEKKNRANKVSQDKNLF